MHTSSMLSAVSNFAFQMTLSRGLEPVRRLYQQFNLPPTLLFTHVGLCDLMLCTVTLKLTEPVKREKEKRNAILYLNDRAFVFNY